MCSDESATTPDAAAAERLAGVDVIAPLTVLLLCQLLGEFVVRAAALPLPGPVVGMGLLFAALVMRGGVPPALERLSEGLLANLSLLFVPAGVGVMLHLPLIAHEWAPIAAALVVSTLLTIAVTALVMRALAPLPTDTEIKGGPEG